jgi:dihydroorotase
MTDLILRGGRVVCPAQAIDGVMDVAFSGGRIERIAPRIDAAGATVQDVAGLIVAPGLIDMHTHVYWGASSMSLDPVQMAPISGVTTMVDAGTAGAGNFEGFRHFVIEPSPVRIIPFLNISYPGIYAYSRRVMVGECADLRLLDQRECLRVIEENADLIVGIKVRVGRIAGGDQGVMPLDMAIEVGEECGLPVMSHLDDAPPTRREVLERLRPGDILTHCFKPFPNAPVRPSGAIHEEVRIARDRGVVFDIGHGAFSFGLRVTRAMLDNGFVPDVISSDVHALNVDGPVFDQLATLSKFYCLGLDLMSVIRCSTTAPAAAIRRPELGTLRPGAIGDATVFAIEDGEFRYTDALSEVLVGKHRFRCKALVQNGVYTPAAQSREEAPRMFNLRYRPQPRGR